MAALFDALGGAQSFDGFAAEDFDAFQRKKWASRVYTMERRSAREKVVALCREALSLDPDRFELGASDDAPSMANNRRVDGVWAFLTRPADARSAISSRVAKTDLGDAASLFDLAVEHEHASVILRIDLEGVGIELHVSPKARVDRLNAERKLGFDQDRTALHEQLAQLAPEVTVGFEGALHSAPSISPEIIESWTSDWEGPTPFVVRRTWPRDQEELGHPDFAKTVRALAEGLLPIYTHLAWAQDNDFAKVAVEKTVKKAEEKASARRMKKGGGGSSDPKVPSLEPGARVTILSGLFAGRGGYLAEIDGKGQAKVMVGPVSVTVPATDVKPAAGLT